MNSRLTDLQYIKLPRWEELPEIGLYMDQLLTYLNGVLLPLSADQSDQITSNMVNNYVKNSIVKKPVKRLYKRYHIAFLIIVVLLKRCFSLAQISEFIQIYSNIEDPNRIARDYNKSITIFEELLQQVSLGNKCEPVYFEHPTYEQELMMLVLHSVVYKIATEFLLPEKSDQKKTQQKI